MSKRNVTLLSVVALVVIGFALHAQEIDEKDGLPKAPNPQRLVSDFANVFTAAQEQQLENKLVAYNDSTSTQILVITTNDLLGWDIAQYSYKIGDKWGVGQREEDNGVVITLKPGEHGEIFIAPGKGAEGRLTDPLVNRITDDVMVPYFARGDNYGGIVAGVNAVQQALAGEYQGQPRQRSQGGRNIMFWIVLAILVIWILTRRRGGGRGMIGRRGYRGFGPVFFPPIGGGFGGGGFGGGGFGGGGGGFGGFGGGSFGGGGAGGRW